VTRPSSLENIFPPKHFVKVVDPLTFARILPLPPSKKHTNSRSQRNTPHANLSLSLSLYIYIYMSFSFSLSFSISLSLSYARYPSISIYPSHYSIRSCNTRIYRYLRVRVPQEMKGRDYARGRRETKLMMKYTSRGDCTTVTNRSRGGRVRRAHNSRVCVYAADYLITKTSTVWVYVCGYK